MSLTKSQASFDRMMEENREQERLEFLEREQRFLMDRGVSPSGPGFTPVPSRNGTASRGSNPSRDHKR